MQRAGEDVAATAAAAVVVVVVVVVSIPVDMEGASW